MDIQAIILAAVLIRAVAGEQLANSDEPPKEVRIASRKVNTPRPTREKRPKLQHLYAHNRKQSHR